MKNRISSADFCRYTIGLFLLAIGGGILFVVVVTPGNQVAVALLSGALGGSGAWLILGAK